MGNSKVILISAVSLIIGLYSMGIKTAEKNALQPAIERANAIEGEELSKAGLHMAMDDLASYPHLRSLQLSQSKVLWGDTLNYTISPNAAIDTATVVVTSYHNGATTVVKGSVRKIADPVVTWMWWSNIYRGRWAIMNSYTQAN